MNRPPSLPLRPHKHADESVIGYLIRIAYVNHFPCLASFIKSYDANRFTVSYNEKSLREMASFLTDVLGRPVAFDEENMVGIYTSLSRLAASKKINVLRKASICPECVKEYGFMKAEWQYALNSYCERHKCEHINVCSCCKGELQWNVALIQLKCQRCGADLHSNKIERIPEHIQKLNKLQGSEREDYINNLVQVALKLMRPFDLMIKKITSSPIMLENWNGLLHSAALHIENNRDIPTSYDLLENSELRNNYVDYIQSPLVSAFVKNLKYHPSNEECRYFMNEDALEKWLGLKSYHLQTIIEMGLAKTVFKKPYCGSFIYDYRCWKTLFKNLVSLEENGLEINAVAEEAPVFWCHPEETVVGVLLGKIPIKFKDPSQPSFEKAWVDRKAAHEYFKKRRSLLNEVTISQQNAFLVTGKSTIFLRKMYRESKVKKFRTTARVSVVGLDSLKQAVETYKIPERDNILQAFE